MFEDFDALELARQQANGPTLALLKPQRIVGLDIRATDHPEWTADEKAKLVQLQQQGNLFDDIDRDLNVLKKLPFDFHYRYECQTSAGTKAYRHKIVDWEIGALFWNVRRQHGDSWEAPFRAKIEQELPGKDLMSDGNDTSFPRSVAHRKPDLSA